jgi:hypothetical protein
VVVAAVVGGSRVPAYCWVRRMKDTTRHIQAWISFWTELLGTVPLWKGGTMEWAWAVMADSSAPAGPMRGLSSTEVDDGDEAGALPVLAAATNDARGV